MNPIDVDLDYLRSCLLAAPFIPYPWEGEDRNLAAFRSREELIAWYCQPPGVAGQPYRDRGFYTRELAMLSRVIKPKRIVEFGTSLGIGTCLLRWLNPEAHLVTVDVNTETFLPGDKRVPMGYLAKHENIAGEYVTLQAKNYIDYSGVDLCFIDADHTYEAVINDTWRAWANSMCSRTWAIAWHDYNDRHSGVMRAVNEFCKLMNITLQARIDSDTVWIMGGK